MEVFEFSENRKLSEIFRKYSCRKYNNGFSLLFENYLKSISNENPNILEIGVGTISLEPPIGRHYVPENMFSWKESNPNYEPGNSLRAFRDFLDSGMIYGIDIQKDCLIKEDRIETHIFDSRNPKMSSELVIDKKFDLIIDDSDKDANIRILTLNNFYESLKDEGYYVIEGLLELKFLEEYLTYKEIHYIIVDDFMILNKKNNFNLINQIRNKTSKSLEVKQYKNEIIKDYSSEISSSPEFSIGGCVFAEKGFYINLEKSIERRENVERMIIEYGIEGLLRFEALTDDMIQFACTKSHLQVFKTCIENNINSVFVAEDDFNIDNVLYQPNSETVYFQEKINLIKKDLDNLEWDVFLFGCNPKTHLVPLTNNVAIVNKSTGAWAYVIRKRAFEFLVNNLNYKRDYIAIDDYLPILNDNGFTTLTSIPLTIGHAVGFVSTLQPRGPVNYSDWIKGNYHKFLFDNYPDNNYITNKIEKNLTVFIQGDFNDEYLKNLRYTLKSLPYELRKCRFILRVNCVSDNHNSSEFFKLGAYFRDVRNDLNLSTSYVFDDKTLDIEYLLENIKTPYVFILNVGDIILKKDSINLNKIISNFDDYNFINIVQFSQDELMMKGENISIDKNGNLTPFEMDSRLNDLELTFTVSWKNNPAICRVSMIKNLFENYTILDLCKTVTFNYNEQLKHNTWNEIKDNWGVYLYGKLGDKPHTSKICKKSNKIKTISEINAENYIIENFLTEND